MHRRTWKKWESHVAADLGGRRMPVTGVDRHGADVVTDMFHCQLKLRNSLPSWLWTWLAGIVATTPKGKTGVLILRKPRMENTEALVVMRYGDFVELHGTPRAGEE